MINKGSHTITLKNHETFIKKRINSEINDKSTGIENTIFKTVVQDWNNRCQHCLHYVTLPKNIHSALL